MEAGRGRRAAAFRPYNRGGEEGWGGEGRNPGPWAIGVGNIYISPGTHTRRGRTNKRVFFVFGFVFLSLLNPQSLSDVIGDEKVSSISAPRDAIVKYSSSNTAGATAEATAGTTTGAAASTVAATGGVLSFFSNAYEYLEELSGCSSDVFFLNRSRFGFSSGFSMIASGSRVLLFPFPLLLIA